MAVFFGVHRSQPPPPFFGAGGAHLAVLVLQLNTLPQRVFFALLCAVSLAAPPAGQLSAWKEVMGTYIRSREFSDEIARLRAQETR